MVFSVVFSTPVEADFLILIFNLTGIDGEDDEGGDDEWSRGVVGNVDRGDGPWDDIEDQNGLSRTGGTGGGLDLADFAAATLKFRSDTRDLGQQEITDDGRFRMAADDEMDKLFREQKNYIIPDNVGDNDEAPEWGDAYINNMFHQNLLPIVPGPEISNPKRSLLFEVNSRLT